MHGVWLLPFLSVSPLVIRRLLSTVGVAFVVLAMIDSPEARAWFPVRNVAGPYAYMENFTNGDPFVPWTSNGTYFVHYKGITSSANAAGQKAFKLAVTFGTAKYVYFRIPVNMPVPVGSSFQADVYLSRDSGVTVAIGPEILYRPSPFVGFLNNHNISQVGRWIPLSSDLSAEADTMGSHVLKLNAGGATIGDVVPWISQIGLYLYSKTGGSVTLYVNHIWITGRPPDNKSQLQLADMRWRRYLQQIHEEVPDLVSQVTSLGKTLHIDQDVAYAQKARRDAQLAAESMRARGFPDGNAYSRLRQEARQLATLRQNEATGDTIHALLSLYPRKAITNNWPSPTTYPLPQRAGGQMVVQATPGEYEATAFTLHAFDKLSNVHIAVGALHGAGGTINQKAIDVRLVKYWYQSAKGSISRDWKFGVIPQSFLLPALLVHDDALVRVDTRKKINYLRATGQNGKSYYLDISSTPSPLPKDIVVSDSATLQPFDVDMGKNKQVWMTIHVPKNQKAGVYTGMVKVTVNGQPSGELGLKLQVLPFHLAEPSIDYAIYYRGTLARRVDTISDGPKTLAQYTRELKDIRNHGIQAVTVYDQEPDVEEALELRRALGFRTDKAFLVGTGTGTPKNREQRAALTARVRREVAEARRAGYATTYFYGKEESHGAAILQQRKTWEAVHRGGGKVFTAVYPGAVNYVGDLLDLANIANVLDKGLAARWHSYRKLVFSYSNPQSGIEEPETYRRNYGLKLWCAGYNGAMIYAYQAQMGPNIWNDFDSPVYRNEVFAYPTSNGVVDTIEWEGLRAGIDDVRYATTLLKVAGGSASDMNREICRKVSESDHPHSIRTWMIKQIMLRIRGKIR